MGASFIAYVVVALATGSKSDPSTAFKSIPTLTPYLFRAVSPAPGRGRGSLNGRREYDNAMTRSKIQEEAQQRLLPLEKGANFMERLLLTNIGVLATPTGRRAKKGIEQGDIQTLRNAWC